MTPVIGPNGELLSGPGADQSDQGGADSDTGAVIGSGSPGDDRCSPGGPVTGVHGPNSSSPGVGDHRQSPGLYRRAGQPAGTWGSPRLSPCDPVTVLHHQRLHCAGGGGGGGGGTVGVPVASSLHQLTSLYGDAGQHLLRQHHHHLHQQHQQQLQQLHH